MLLAAGMQTPDAYAVVLVQDGVPAATIVVSADARDPARDAAGELQLYIRRISGAEMRIVDDGANVEGPKVLVGESRYTREVGLSNDGFADQGYLIRTSGDDLILMGRDESDAQAAGRKGRSFTSRKHYQKIGTLYAVYSFLETCCGVRWYMPTEIGEVVPETATIRVAPVDVQRKPSSRYRALFAYHSIPAKLWTWKYTKVARPEAPFVSGEDMLRWARAMKLGGTAFAANHGQYGYYKRFGEEHPDWFANSTPQGGNQLCYSHPGAFAQVVQDARDFFDGTLADSSAWAIGDFYSVMPMDTKTWCQCDACGSKYGSDPDAGDYASRYVWDFVCRVARELKKTHPGKFISCCSYWAYAEMPEDLDVPDNVAVMMTVGHYRYWDDKAREADHRRIRAWSRKTRHLYFWDYYLFPQGTSFDRFPSVAPHEIAREIAFRKTLGLNGGMMCQMDEHYWRNVVLDHVRVYVTLKLLDDWDQDVDVILDEYYRLFYGPAEEPMKAFFETIEEIPYRPREKESVYTHADYDWMVLCPETEIKRLGDLLDTAAGRTPGDTLYRKRVELVRNAVYEAVLVSGRHRVLAIMKRTKSIDCPAAPVPPSMDGRLDDVCWRKAGRTREWTSIDGGPAPRATTALVTHDAGYLYVAFECEDKDDYAPVAMCKTPDGGTYMDDSVEVFIDVGHKRKGAYAHLVVNTVPVIYDATVRNAAWNSAATAAGRVDAGKWTIELAIPMESLGVVGTVKPGDTWGINFCRNRRGLPGFVSPFMNWSAPGSYHRPSRFGKLVFGE